MAPPADRAHRAAQRRLDEAIAARLAAILAGIADPTVQAAMDVYNLAAVAVVGGGQRRSVQLAFAYVGALIAYRRAPRLERALEPVLVTRASPVTRSPILRVWKLLEEGAAREEAVARASSYAGELASNDLQVAQRGGLDEAAHASGQRIRGWRKDLSPTACEWCVRVGSKSGRYKSAESVPFHENDRCGVVPVFEAEE